MKFGALNICMENLEILGRIQMEQFMPVEIFQKKVIPFKVLPFSCSYQNDQNFLYHLFGLPVPGFMSRRSEIFSHYFVNGTTQSHSCFRCQKKYQYRLMRNFHQNFCTNGSWTPVLALGLICQPNA